MKSTWMALVVESNHAAPVGHIGKAVLEVVLGCPARLPAASRSRSPTAMDGAVIAGGRAHTGRRDFAHILRPEIRVALELVPGLMARELRALVNLIATLEQTAGGFVPQIVETRILDSRARVSHTWQARVKAAPTLFG